MADAIDFSGSKVEFNGQLFSGDAAKKLKRNLGRHVRDLTVLGQRTAVNAIGVRSRTGFSARSVDAYQKFDGSLYGKVRVEKDLIRPDKKPTATYPAKRIPYVIMAVLETGRRGGFKQQRVTVNPKTGRVRSRAKWQSGNRTQKPLYAFRKAARLIRQEAPKVRESVLLEGLE